MNKELRWLIKEKYPNLLNSLNHPNFPNIPSFPSNLKKDLNRLKKGEPLDYVIGFKDFLGCKIDLSLKPLIPRPETEFWVEILIRRLENIKIRKLNILDLCCGSGCIGIAILKHAPKTHVIFADISKKALNQTRLNLNLNSIPTINYKLLTTNLFKNIPNKTFHLITCNPPYVNPKGPFNKSILYEPKGALFAPQQGLKYIFKILRTYKKYLSPKGQLWLEFGDNQKDKIKNILEKLGIDNASFYNDQFNKPRYLLVVDRPGLEPGTYRLRAGCSAN